MWTVLRRVLGAKDSLFAHCFPGHDQGHLISSFKGAFFLSS